MAYYKFDEDDLFLNTVQTYPQTKFYIQSGTVYINNFPHVAGENTTNDIGVPKGFISLYEYNIDRPSNSLIRPFLIKDGMKNAFKTTNTGSYAVLPLSSRVFSSYNMSASITRFISVPHATLFPDPTQKKLVALENTFNHYSYLSPHYQYSSPLGDKTKQVINFIDIPSIFYGSEIKKGSVSLKFYVTGTLIGELQDFRSNGDLVQVGPYGSTGSGSVAGSILYNEGIISLTGSWSLDSNQIRYDALDDSRWKYFGFGTNNATNIANAGKTTLSASYSIEFSGSNQFQTMTMLAHAKYNDLNHSTNPTFIKKTDKLSVSTGSYQYIEQAKEIKNIVSSSFIDKSPVFEKTTYLSKIGIYDENHNLIGIAKMATPVRKTEADQYTFKLKLDI
jgi:hypothetical protein